MKINYLFLILISISIVSCNQSKPVPVTTPIDSTQQKTEEKKIDSFFPVTSFLRGQMVITDSLPITPLHFFTVNGKTDSAWLKPNELHAFLQPFFSPAITSTNLTSLFKETSFNDLSLNAVTFTYDPTQQLPDSLNLRHWDVYINPQTGKVFKVYIVKNIKENNKTYIQQLTWQVGEYAKIVNIYTEGKIATIKEDKFVWKF